MPDMLDSINYTRTLYKVKQTHYLRSNFFLIFDDSVFILFSSVSKMSSNMFANKWYFEIIEINQS